MSCSPTKVGEYWAAGLPVVSNSGIGDTEDIVRECGVGVIVDDFSPAGMLEAARALSALLADPATAGRCRQAARDHYSLDAAVARQIELYQRLARRSATA